MDVQGKRIPAWLQGLSLQQKAAIILRAVLRTDPGRVVRLLSCDAQAERRKAERRLCRSMADYELSMSGAPVHSC